MSKNKSYSNEFKFKVTLEIIKGDLTVAEIISKYQVPRSVLCKWKRIFIDNGSNIFKHPSAQSSKLSRRKELEKLHATIGKLKVENDFLQEASSKLNL